MSEADDTVRGAAPAASVSATGDSKITPPTPQWTMPQRQPQPDQSPPTSGKQAAHKMIDDIMGKPDHRSLHDKVVKALHAIVDAL